MQEHNNNTLYLSRILFISIVSAFVKVLVVIGSHGIHVSDFHHLVPETVNMFKHALYHNVKAVFLHASSNGMQLNQAFFRTRTANFEGIKDRSTLP